MKKIIVLLIILLIFLSIILFKNNILSFLEDKLFISSTLEKNEYSRSYNFNYVSNTDNFYPKNKKDLLNVFYTFLNSGMEEFSFYCTKEYKNCKSDIKAIEKDKTEINSIINYIHPYNSIKNLEVIIYTYGKITIKTDKLYDDRMKYIIDFDIDKIIENNIKDSMTDREKIKVIHDYIINNAKYDKDWSDKKINKYKSNTAFGALEEGHGVCNGYADSMMLFLDRFGIKNYKIAAENHVWNYVYIENNWYHLDLTWDDPINKENKDLLEYNYFLITDQELEKLDNSYHAYDKTIYSP